MFIAKEESPLQHYRWGALIINCTPKDVKHQLGHVLSNLIDIVFNKGDFVFYASSKVNRQSNRSEVHP